MYGRRNTTNNLVAVLRGYAVRWRLVHKLLRYIGTVSSILPSHGGLDMVPEASKEFRQMFRAEKNFKPVYSDLRRLMCICGNLRRVARETGVPRLADVLTIEDVFQSSECCIPTNTPWSKQEANFLSTSIVVRRWDVGYCEQQQATADMATIPSTIQLRHSVGTEWKDSAGVITRFRGVRIVWAKHITVYGYFIDIPLAILNSVFPRSRARVQHIGRMLREQEDLNEYIVAATRRDLSPRDILVLTDNDIIARALSFQSIKVDLRSITNTVTDKQQPLDMVTHLYVMAISPEITRARVRGRVLFECVCSHHSSVVPHVGTTISKCLPEKARESVCCRMIGLPIQRQSSHTSSLSLGNRLGGGDKKKVPLDERVRLRFEKDHPKVYHAASDRLREFREFRSGTDSHGKASQWLEALLNLPIGKYTIPSNVSTRTNILGSESTAHIFDDIAATESALVRAAREESASSERHDTDLVVRRPTVAWSSHWDRVRDYRIIRDSQSKALQDAKKIMEKTVHGCKSAKRVVHQLVAQWIGNKAGGAVIGLQGPPGVGKTTFVREGLARCFGTDDQPHPFEFISLGGATNSSSLVGWKYTWHTSTYGRIAAALMRHSCMNPILYFDELDKVSRTNEGREIISILTHLTDLSQNSAFEDRYFEGVPIDLSRCIIVFSYNDASAIDRILLDRLQQIRIPAMSITAKCEVAKKFLLPSICKEIGVPLEQYTVPNSIVRHFAMRYTREAGVRHLKNMLATLVRERNRQWLSNDIVPQLLTEKDAEALLLNQRPARIDRVSCDESFIGSINALHAGGSTGGGVTPVQVVRVSAGQFKRRRACSAPKTGTNGDECKSKTAAPLPEWSCIAPRILITGRQGETMSEAAHVAATVASVIAEEADEVYFHLHCPDGATPKDGPSAGCAFALAFLSVLQNKPIRQNLALTGELDLLGRVRPVGGIGSKVGGAILHGVEIILLPEDNREDAEMYLKENPLPDNVTLHFVRTVGEAARYALQQ